MNPYYFNFAQARTVSLEAGQVISHRLVTQKDSGSSRLGFHITEGQPGVSGVGATEPDRDEIIYVFSGSITILVAGQARTLGANEGLFVPAGTVYDWVAGPDGWRMATIFSPPLE